jgi:hypothetical protein
MHLYKSHVVKFEKLLTNLIKESVTLLSVFATVSSLALQSCFLIASFLVYSSLLCQVGLPCNLSTWEVKAGGLQFQASLGCKAKGLKCKHFFGGTGV